MSRLANQGYAQETANCFYPEIGYPNITYATKKLRDRIEGQSSYLVCCDQETFCCMYIQPSIVKAGGEEYTVNPDIT